MKVCEYVPCRLDTLCETPETCLRLPGAMIRANIDCMTTSAPQPPQSPAATASVIQAVATAVGEGLSARCVILFGSRARGDHHEWSDVDLAVISGGVALDPEQRRYAVDAAIESVRSTTNGKFPRIDVIVWTEEEYRLKKRSINHVAGRAWREGRILYGTHEDRPGEEVVSELDNAKQLMTLCRRQVRGMQRLMDPEDDEENFGFHAQRAVEMALKAWVGLAGLRYERTHNIGDLITTLDNAGVAGARDYADLGRLTPYAVKYIYENVPEQAMDRSSVFERVSELVNRVEALLQQSEAEVGL